MPGENSQDNTKQNQSYNQGDSKSTADQNKGSSDQSDKGQEKVVPYERFSEVNTKFKTANAELEKYREKERLENEKKLIDEKNFQELIGNKDKKINDLVSELNQTKTERKIDSLKSKISNILSKNNIIDAEDGLKFVKFDDLIDSDDADDEINKRIGELTKSKTYLFKPNQGSQSNSRSKSENNIPGNNSPIGNQNNQKKSVSDTVLASLASKYSS